MSKLFAYIFIFSTLLISTGHLPLLNHITDCGSADPENVLEEVKIEIAFHQLNKEQEEERKFDFSWVDTTTVVNIPVISAISQNYSKSNQALYILYNAFLL